MFQGAYREARAVSTAFANQPPAGMSVDVEDWFMASNLASAVDASSWSRRESRVEASTDRVLQGLADHGITGTFFVLGWVAERCPALIDRIGGAGHEVAAHGMNHEPVHALSAAAFRDDVRRCKDLLEQRTGQAVHGYRAPDFSITEWAVDVLQEVGFTYDSSAFPKLGNRRYGTLRDMDARDPVREIRAGFHEACVSCVPIGRRGPPWGGGGWFRLLPYPLFRRGVSAVLKGGRPFVFYIHPWELDPGQPRLRDVPWGRRFRHTVNIERCEARWRRLLGDFQWTNLLDVVGRCATAAPARRPATDPGEGAPADRARA